MSKLGATRRKVYYFRTCEGRWVKYLGWKWGLLPPEDRKWKYAKAA